MPPCFWGGALHGVGTGELEMRECTDGPVPNDAALFEDFVKFGHSLATSVQSHVGHSPNIHRVKTDAQLVRCSGVEEVNGPPATLTYLESRSAASDSFPPRYVCDDRARAHVKHKR